MRVWCPGGAAPLPPHAPRWIPRTCTAPMPTPRAPPPHPACTHTSPVHVTSSHTPSGPVRALGYPHSPGNRPPNGICTVHLVDHWPHAVARVTWHPKSGGGVRQGVAGPWQRVGRLWPPCVRHGGTRWRPTTPNDPEKSGRTIVRPKRTVKKTHPYPWLPGTQKTCPDGVRTLGIQRHGCCGQLDRPGWPCNDIHMPPTPTE